MIIQAEEETDPNGKKKCPRFSIFLCLFHQPLFTQTSGNFGLTWNNYEDNVYLLQKGKIIENIQITEILCIEA